MRRVAAGLLLPALLCAAVRADQPAAPNAYVVVFDFVSSDGNRFGKRLADSVRLRLRRH